MVSQNKKIAVTGMSAVFSVLTAIISLFILFILAAALDGIESIGDLGDWLAYMGYFVFIAIACFLICRKYPLSVWFAPVICNATGIISALVEPNFWISDLWKVNIIGWVLTLISAVIGSVIGRLHPK
jgi:hypothetical protein